MPASTTPKASCSMFGSWHTSGRSGRRSPCWIWWYRGGYHCPTALTRDPWLDSLRASPEFVRLVRQAEAGHARAAEAYTRAGGERILGVGAG
jgi:hypothetical protein